MSKIDRFLISDGLLSIFPQLSGLILTRHLSDHRPLLLQEAHFDYGATPFRLFDSWLLETDFAKVVEDNWKHDGVADTNAIVKLKNKLKSLKNRLKIWNKSKVDERCNSKKMWRSKLEEIEKCVEDGHEVPNEEAYYETYFGCRKEGDA